MEMYTNNSVVGTNLGNHPDSKALAECSSRAILGMHLRVDDTFLDF